MEHESITCIVLNWNGGEDTVECVNSLLASRGVNINIILVDNGSSDGSDVLIKNLFPQVRLHKNSENTGVAKAWNAALQCAFEGQAAFVFFLNNDALVDQDCLSTLLQTMQSTPGAAIVSPRILDSRNAGTIWFDGGVINVFGHPRHRHFSHAPQFGARLFDEHFATGCAMLVRVDLFKKIGLFDESYFAYCEDSDLCFRARANGYTIMHNPRALATHYPSTATIKNRGKWFRDYYVTRNSLILGQRYWNGTQRIMFFGYFFFVGVVGPMVHFAVTGQTRRLKSVAEGTMDFVRGKNGRRYG